eukprot:g32817.t1
MGKLAARFTVRDIKMQVVGELVQVKYVLSLQSCHNRLWHQIVPACSKVAPKSVHLNLMEECPPVVRRPVTGLKEPGLVEGSPLFSTSAQRGGGILTLFGQDQDQDQCCGGYSCIAVVTVIKRAVPQDVPSSTSEEENMDASKDALARLPPVPSTSSDTDTLV